MKSTLFTRREILTGLAAGALAHGLRAADATQPARKRPHIKKAFMLNRLNRPNPPLDVLGKFKLIKAAGFDGVEATSSMNQRDVLAARDATGLTIASVVGATGWTKPLSDPNPTAREAGLNGLLQSLRDAAAYDADSVLLVPAVVKADVPYAAAYERSRGEIKKALPLAAELRVAIAIENVWNNFLLSPMEAAAYVDSFESPWVKWHLDIGNIGNLGWAEHWIPILGKRIAKIHIKEYSRTLRDTKGPHAGFQVDLMDGDNNWPAIMAALDQIGYSGWAIAEQFRPEGFSDADWLSHLAKRMDRAINA
jgi:L-ribulose-5-phosphate 3-epimerase